MSEMIATANATRACAKNSPDTGYPVSGLSLIHIFIAPLVGLDGGPVDVHIGLLFQTLEDGAVVRFGFAAHREAGHTLSLIHI